MNRRNSFYSKDYQTKLKQHRQRPLFSRHKGKMTVSARKKKSWTGRIVVFTGICLTVIVVGGIAFWLFFFPSDNTQTIPPVMQLELVSNPAGATVLVGGKEKGVTPLKLPIGIGRHKLEFRKSGYSAYFTEIEIDAQSKTTHKTTSITNNTSLPTTVISDTASNQASVNSTPVISDRLTAKALPTYPFSVELWPDRVIMQPLPKPIPNARIEYARYLNNQTLELTYLAAEGELLPPGAEGLPTNLWLYRPVTGEPPRPVVLTQATFQALARYHLTNSNSNSETTNSASLLSGLAVTTPVVSPEVKRLAFVSNSLVKNSANQNKPTSPANTASEAIPAWDDQAIWISRLADLPSAGGAILTRSEAATEQPLRLFSLKDLQSILPGLIVPDKTANTFSSNQRFATIRQLSWSLAGDKLLAVIEVNDTALSGSRSGSGNGIATFLALIGIGGGSAPGQVSIVTPQPLTEEVLPGTIRWSADGTAISFLVNQNRLASGSNGSIGLCLLDLSYHANANTQARSGAGTSIRTPLHYVGQISSAKVWVTQNSSNLSNLQSGRIYPPIYGAIRYNPFAWPWPPIGSDATKSQNLATLGFYSALPENSRGNSQYSINNLYAYSLNEGVSRPIPLVTVSPNVANSKAPTATPRPGQLPAQIKTGSYPYLQAGSSPLYLAVRPATGDKEGNKKQSSGGLLGSDAGGVTWQLGIETFALPPEIEMNFQNGSEVVTVALGLTLKKLSERRDPTTLTLPGSIGTTIAGLAPGRLEAYWRPDSKGVLLALPTITGQNNNLWLASWS
ncbi:MAG TPA: PEGA domain-containing protein [Chloroflexia bacterium]|nr:PEGA domain-containing protein [Chloroflexia bacterium]